MKKNIIILSLIVSVGISVVGCSQSSSSSKQLTAKTQSYEMNNIQSKRIKTFLEKLQTNGFKISDIKRLDVSSLKDDYVKGKIKKGQLKDQETLNALGEFATDSYIVNVNGQPVEIYDHSEYKAEQDRTETVEAKDKKNATIGETDVNTYNIDDNSHEKYVWYNTSYKDHVRILVKDNSDKDKIMEIFNN